MRKTILLLYSLATFLILAFTVTHSFAAEAPTKEGAYVDQGNANFSKGQYDEAIANYNKALEINPKYAEAYNNRGQTYYAKSQFDQAIADYNKALEINPKLAEAYNNRGQAYYAKGQYDQAISDLDKALELNPKYAEAYFNKALAYEKIGSKKATDAAIDAYKDFVKYASDKYASLVEQTKKHLKELEEKVK